MSDKRLNLDMALEFSLGVADRRIAELGSSCILQLIAAAPKLAAFVEKLATNREWTWDEVAAEAEALLDESGWPRGGR